MPPFLAKYGIYIGLVVLAALALFIPYCVGHKAGKTGEVAHEQARTIDLQQKVGVANENAGTARVADATKAVQQERELKDALDASNDPARARVLRGCLIMRQQGRDTGNIPACRGPTAGR